MPISLPALEERVSVVNGTNDDDDHYHHHESNNDKDHDNNNTSNNHENKNSNNDDNADNLRELAGSILPSSWCEASEEVGPDATHLRQSIGQNWPKPAKNR